MKTEPPLKSLKAFDLKAAQLSLWIVHRSLTGGVAHYGVLKVTIGQRLKGRMKAVVKNAVEECNSIRDYDYLTTDQDGDSLLLDSNETDFSRILASLEEAAIGPEIKTVKTEKDLIGAWGYIIEASSDKERVYAFRQVSQSWSTKRCVGYNVIFSEQKLEELDSEAIFKLDGIIDFLCWRNQLFIRSKVAFEKGMNFRASLEKRRDLVVNEFTSLDFLKNPSDVTTYCGVNLNHLRKLASVSKNGYYKNPDYLEKLRDLNDKESWGIQFVGNKIIVEQDKFDLLLRLLNNDRLRSPITEDLYDVSQKTLVSR